MDGIFNSDQGSVNSAQTSLIVPDFLNLYRSLVRDGALPEGYDREFLSLEPIVRAAFRRENAKAMKVDSVSAALWLDRCVETLVDLDWLGALADHGQLYELQATGIAM